MPNLRIIQENLRRLEKPAQKAIFYWDEKDTGFGIKANPTSLTYIAEARVKGKTRRVKLGTYPALSPDEARQEGADLYCSHVFRDRRHARKAPASAKSANS